MFEPLIDRTERAGMERARRLSTDLAERLRSELPPGIEAEATEAGVSLSGPRIGARFAVEPDLRWLMARML